MTFDIRKHENLYVICICSACQQFLSYHRKEWDLIGCFLRSSTDGSHRKTLTQLRELLRVEKSHFNYYTTITTTNKNEESELLAQHGVCGYSVDRCEAFQEWQWLQMMCYKLKQKASPVRHTRPAQPSSQALCGVSAILTKSAVMPPSLNVLLSEMQLLPESKPYLRLQSSRCQHFYKNINGSWGMA